MYSAQRAEKARTAGCPSGQWEQTVNLSVKAYVGSNPTPATPLTRRALYAESAYRARFVMSCGGATPTPRPAGLRPPDPPSSGCGGRGSFVRTARVPSAAWAYWSHACRCLGALIAYRHSWVGIASAHGGRLDAFSVVLIGCFVRRSTDVSWRFRSLRVGDSIRYLSSGGLAVPGSPCGVVRREASRIARRIGVAQAARS